MKQSQMWIQSNVSQSVVMRGRTMVVMNSTNNRIDSTQGRTEAPKEKSQFKVGRSKIGDRKEIGA